MNQVKEPQTHAVAAPKRVPAKRSRRNAARIGRLERTQPLRRRILEALFEAGGTPSALAEQLEAQLASVSRILKALLAESLVAFEPVPGDKRQRFYTLTEVGEVELSRHHSYGAAPTVVSPSDEERVRFLYSALDRAVVMRRQNNELEEAARRIRIVLRQAHKVEDGGLIVEANNELATTLRQNGEHDELEQPLDELEKIALGTSTYDSPVLAMPALAHREYALGRMGHAEKGEWRRSVNQLGAAASIYSQLAGAATHLPSGKWRERQAWSLVSQSGTLRAATRLEEALELAAEALAIFEEIEDPYGRSHCLFQFGFCLRLLGDFEGAWGWLNEAHKLAEEHSFERFQADSLMQIGEVLRCLHDFDGAREVLEESRERSVRMGLPLTQAFAHSCLGAVAFHQDRLQDARLELNRAQERFAGLDHRRGLALNSVREVSVSRLLFRESAEPLENVERLAAIARGYCETPRSPAGIAAVDVAAGRLALLRKEAPAETIDHFWNLLENETPERELLELDPWIPRLLHEFAKEAEDKEFEQRSERLLATAQRRLRAAAKTGIERVAQLIGRNADCTIEAPGAPNDFVDEMAGETRQLSSQKVDVALAGAIGEPSPAVATTSAA